MLRALGFACFGVLAHQGMPADMCALVARLNLLSQVSVLADTRVPPRSAAWSLLLARSLELALSAFFPSCSHTLCLTPVLAPSHFVAPACWLSLSCSHACACAFSFCCACLLAHIILLPRFCFRLLTLLALSPAFTCSPLCARALVFLLPTGAHAALDDPARVHVARDPCRLPGQHKRPIRRRMRLVVVWRHHVRDVLR